MAYSNVSNDVSAVTPEIWSKIIQKPLRKRLVSMEIANTRFVDEVKEGGDTIHVQYHGDLSAKVYTPGTKMTATAQNWHTDTINVTAHRYEMFYVDPVEDKQANVAVVAPLMREASYRIRDFIDSAVLGKVHLGVDTGAKEVAGSATANRSVSATSANIIQIFSNAAKVLNTANVENEGDWAAVLTPKLVAAIQMKATGVGYNFADSALRNGFLGDFMGFQVYWSNNVQSASIHTTTAETANVWNIFMGKKKTIELVMQRAPTVQINKVDNMLGRNYIISTTIGTQVLTKNASRFLNVEVHNTYAK